MSLRNKSLNLSFNKDQETHNVSLMFDRGRSGNTNGSGNLSGVTRLLMSTNKALNSTGMAISRIV